MTTVEATAPAETASAAERSVPRSGWLVVASKEFADHVLSVRFFVLLIVLGLAAGIPLFLATERIHELASQVSGAQAVFLALFIIGPQDVSIFGLDVSVQGFIGLRHRCSGSPSPSTRSTASAHRARCRAWSPSRSTATT